MGNHSTFSFKPKKFLYLKDKTIGCTDQYFYEKFEEVFVADVTELCPKLTLF